MRKITFPRIWPARAVASRTLPVTLQPIDAVAVASPILGRATAGGFVSTLAPSARVIDGEGIDPGRSFLGRTADALDSGPAPDRIDRGTRALNAGKVGVGAGPDGVSGWPFDGSSLMIPHQNIPRRPITVTPFARTIDTGVTIPSAPIGDPVS